MTRLAALIVGYFIVAAVAAPFLSPNPALA
jgi:hypothetical protein